MDAETATAPSAAARHLQQMDYSPMAARPQVIKFCYRKRPTGHSRNGKDDSSQEPKIQTPSSPLSRQSLSTPAITTYHAGGFYEINHEMLPPRTPIHLKYIRVVKVTDYTSLDITVSFPSLQALRSFFSSFPAPSAGPELDECFFMSSTHAARILRRPVSEQELEGEMHHDSFWLVNPCLYDFSASSHPATLPDALWSPEDPPAQPKAPAPSCRLLELDTMKRDGAGCGVRRGTSVKEQRRPAQQEDKRSSVSGKRKPDEGGKSNDKHSNKRTQAISKKMPKSIACALFCITVIFGMSSVEGSTATICDSSHLAESVAQYCNSTSRTIECCEPIVFAVDVGGGPDCLCSVSCDPKVGQGHSFKDLLLSYVDCGGLHPQAVYHTSDGFCGALLPPPPQLYYSPPPPRSSAATIKPPEVVIDWDDWNNLLANWHQALGQLPINYLIDISVAALLVLACRLFWGYVELQARRALRWMARQLAWLLGNSAPEQFVDQVELAVFPRVIA